MTGVRVFNDSVTIASSGTESGAAAVPDGVHMARVATPSALTGKIKIQGSVDEGATFQDIYDEDGNVVQIAAAEVGIHEINVAGLDQIRAESDSGTGEAAERVFQVRFVGEDD